MKITFEGGITCQITKQEFNDMLQFMQKAKSMSATKNFYTFNNTQGEIYKMIDMNSIVLIEEDENK